MNPIRFRVTTIREDQGQLQIQLLSDFDYLCLNRPSGFSINIGDEFLLTEVTQPTPVEPNDVSRFGPRKITPRSDVF
jgi:hypothetical protein